MRKTNFIVSILVMMLIMVINVIPIFANNNVLDNLENYMSWVDDEEIHDKITFDNSYPFDLICDFIDDETVNLSFINNNETIDYDKIEIKIGLPDKNQQHKSITIYKNSKDNTIKGLIKDATYQLSVDYYLKGMNANSSKLKFEGSVTLSDKLFNLDDMKTIKSISQCVFTEKEPNDTWINANILKDGKTIGGGFHTKPRIDLVDFYKIKFDKRANANFLLDRIKEGCDFDLFVYNSQGELIISSTNNGDLDEYIHNFTIEPNQWYYIKVQKYYTSEGGTYQLNVKSYPYGCRPYLQQNNQHIKCDSYALRLGINKLGLTKDEINSCTNKAEILELVTNKFEAYFSKMGAGYKKINGYSSLIDVNQFRVVLRIGYIDKNNNGIVDINKGDLFDYHWWYQTKDGVWANKHGSYPSVRCIGTNGDTNPEKQHIDWSLGYMNNFYDSDCVYYAMTTYK